MSSQQGQVGFVFPQVPWGCFAACGTEGLCTGREGGVGRAGQAAGMVAASGQGRAIDKGPLGPPVQNLSKKP